MWEVQKSTSFKNASKRVQVVSREIIRPVTESSSKTTAKTRPTAESSKVDPKDVWSSDDDEGEEQKTAKKMPTRSEEIFSYVARGRFQ